MQPQVARCVRWTPASAGVTGGALGVTYRRPCDGSRMSQEELAAIGGWTGVLRRLIDGARLTSYEAGVVMRDVLAGNATTAQLAGLLCVMRARGETVDELAGLAEAMRAAATPLDVEDKLRGRLVDTCGTGGDRSGTINVSTMAAFIVA